MLTIGGMCQSSLLFRLREIETESLVLEESNRSLSTESGYLLKTIYYKGICYLTITYYS